MKQCVFDFFLRNHWFFFSPYLNRKHNGHSLEHSLSTTFINTGIITVHFVTLAVTKLTKKWKIKNHFMKRKTNYKLPIGDQGERK